MSYRHYSIVVTSVLVLFTSHLLAKPLEVNVNSEAAFLINANTGAVLFEKNADKTYNPASTTKIATALYTLKTVPDKLDVMIRAEQDSIAWLSDEAKRRYNYSQPAYWLEPGCSHIGLKRGEELSLRDLLYGMMLASGDDASNVIAQYVGGTIPNYMNELNSYLQSIGCANTHFENPHGLFYPKHLTTPRDLATLTREALKDPIFSQIVSTVRYPRPKTNKQEASTFVQTNKLLRSGTKQYYPKAIGVKTGYIAAAQNTLVAAAKDGNRTLIAVLMKCKERNDIFDDAARLFESAFNEKKSRRKLLKQGPQKFTTQLPNGNKILKTYANEDVFIDYYPAEDAKIITQIQWLISGDQVKKDEKIARLTITDTNNSFIKSVDLFAQNNVDRTWMSWIKMNLNVFKKFSLALAVIGGAITIAFFYLLNKRSS